MRSRKVRSRRRWAKIVGKRQGLFKRLLHQCGSSLVLSAFGQDTRPPLLLLRSIHDVPHCVSWLTPKNSPFVHAATPRVSNFSFPGKAATCSFDSTTKYYQSPWILVDRFFGMIRLHTFKEPGTQSHSVKMRFGTASSKFCYSLWMLNCIHSGYMRAGMAGISLLCNGIIQQYIVSYAHHRGWSHQMDCRSSKA